ncbi:MAG TPA: TolC family protein [Niabella sp.]|nr:TolC family protein [Chitinophagaceae bacterium]MCZ2130111.1 TolC family protein [Bacteroidia bacterium]HRN46801.1 TolC family protein [Niabella sp.]HRO85257.1 TolC family protein [Niabella sp.]
MNKFYYILRFTPLLALLSIAPGILRSQSVTLEQCHNWSRKNYPLIKNQEHIKSSTKYLNINANRAYFPQLNVNGQGSYQSEVTQIPEFAPNITVPTMSKDQYKLQGELIQTIFDGGFRTSQINMLQSHEKMQLQQLEISMHSVRQQVMDLYFAVLMFDAQLKQQAIHRQNLQNTLDKAIAALANGTTFKSSVNELKAEMINADMLEFETRTNRQAIIEMLNQLTGQTFTATTKFEEPVTRLTNNLTINRPEIKMLDLQKQNILIQKKQAASDLLPTVSAFAMGGYGRPTLNMLSNDFGTYWMAGLRLKWSMNTLFSLPNTLKSLNMNDKMLDVEKETFQFNTKMAIDKENSEVYKYQQLMKRDDEIIALRSSVMESAKVQLDNGVITTTDFIVKLNAESLARATKELHRLQLLKAQYKILNLSGN